MTNREIKLELAKAALANATSLDDVKRFYDWVTKDPERDVDAIATKWDDTPIEKLIAKIRNAGGIMNRCRENNIKTIGDLIRCGARKFKSFKLVGNGTINRIDDALADYFDVEDWYLS